MAITKLQKQAILKLLDEEVKPQKSIVFISPSGAEEVLDAEKNVTFRKAAREGGTVIKMVTIKLLQRAFKALPKDLTGQIYLGFLKDKEKSDEVTVPKQIASLIKKDFKSNFQILGSIVNGDFYDAAKTKMLADTPTYQESMSMLAGSISQVISKNARLVSEIPASLARGVKAIEDKKA